MSTKTSSGDEWELSKENIQPLQQGRKPEVLKQALREHPEDPIQLQRQAFENELRIYSGEDPLSVWCKYINWVEQNFLKGGRDGHIEQLLQKCLSILRDETKYYNDKRFIAIWLKFANVSGKSIEVYNYMYSHNIGCHSADFFIAWSWELEQQHNVNKAYQVLQEGINRNADPIDKVKSAFSEFEMRISRKFMESEQNADLEIQRSAFNMLKPLKKSAPILRVGESVIESNRATMVVDRQQPVPKCNLPSSKVPFKIYNANVVVPALPMQSTGNLPFVLYSDHSKENELKPSKWNKVKVKQMASHARPVSSTEISFNFHCDEAPQPVSTPRSVPKVSDVLRTRQDCKSPRMALFEPPDPMKRPMYDKNKVYGGAEEFSFEEIRAAAWLEKHKLDTYKKSDDPIQGSSKVSLVKRNVGFNIHSNSVNSTKEPVPYVEQRKIYKALPVWDDNKTPLVAVLSPTNPMKCPIYDRNKLYNPDEELSFEEIKASAWLEKQRKLECSQNSQTEIESIQKQIKSLTKKLESLKDSAPEQSDFKKIKNDSTSGFIINQPQSDNETKNENICTNLNNEENALVCSDKPFNHSINNTLSLNKQEQKESTINVSVFGNVPTETFSGIPSVTDILQGKCHPSTSYIEAADMLRELYNDTTPSLENQIIPVFKDSSCNSTCGVKTAVPFTLYQDASEDLQVQKDVFQTSASHNRIPASTPKTDLPFKLYQDPTEIVSDKNDNVANPMSCMKTNLAFNVHQDPTENVSLPNNNVENPFNTVKSNLPFSLYQDPTENFLRPNSSTVNSVKTIKTSVPFSLYQDHAEKDFQPNNVENQISTDKTNFPFNLYQDTMENILPQSNYRATVSSNKSTPTFTTLDQAPNENIENIPPIGFVQNTIKRELNGILTPAKDIFYIPLEQQQMNDDSEDDICVDSNHAQLQNETLMLPCNTEQFVSAPFFSSTPCASAENAKKANLQVSNVIDTCNFGPETQHASTENLNSDHNAQTTNDISSKPVLRTEKSNYPIRPVSSLSVIMETSKESYKSSASSSSSASVTKLSHFNQGYSYEKNSNITSHKEFPCGDTFKEPKPISHRSDISCANNATEGQVQPFDNENRKPVALFVSDIDPFCDQLNEKLLLSLNQPPEHYNRLELSNKNIRYLKINDQIEIKGLYLIENLIAEGAYGKVYVAEKKSLSEQDFTNGYHSKFAIKICKHANEWELYICFSLHQRLKLINNVPAVQQSVMDIVASKKGTDGMILISEFSHQGTLLDLVNFYKKQNSSVPEYLAMYLTLEMLQIMSQIHKCKIIHADIKADNILIRDSISSGNVLEFLDSKTHFLKFIDFGRSIDLTFFEDGICFATPLKSRCIEVLEGKPWVFQPDWYGIFDCIHTLLFSEYAKVNKNAEGRWGIEKKLRRYWATDVWFPLFDELLNISACYEEPDISEHVVRIKAKLLQNAHTLKSNIAHLRNVFFKK